MVKFLKFCGLKNLGENPFYLKFQGVKVWIPFGITIVVHIVILQPFNDVKLNPRGQRNHRSTVTISRVWDGFEIWMMTYDI